MKKRLIIIFNVLFMTAAFISCNYNSTFKLPIDNMKDFKNRDIMFIKSAANDEITKREIENLIDVKINKTVYTIDLKRGRKALENGNTDALYVPLRETAEYIVKKNRNLRYIETDKNNDFSMLMRRDDLVLYDIINSTIIILKNCGKIDELYTTYLINGEEDENIKEIKDEEGKRTVVIGLSGDLPPIDMVNEYGEPKGFTRGLINEIANKTGMNIEIELVASRNALTALLSKKIDLYYCHTNINDTEVIKSIPYITLKGAFLLRD